MKLGNFFRSGLTGMDSNGLFYDLNIGRFFVFEQFVSIVLLIIIILILWDILYILF